jgi:PTH1 family peptidyl-tRNA hydrolase
VLGGGDFTRLRLGIGRPASARVDLADWVLEDFDGDEREAAAELAGRAADAVEVIMAAGVSAAMNRFNVSTTQEGARTSQ